MTLFQTGKVEEAIGWYRKAIDIDPKDAYAYDNLGVALQKTNRLDEAIDCCRKAIEINPKYVNAYVNLGAALR